MEKNEIKRICWCHYTVYLRISSTIALWVLFSNFSSFFATSRFKSLIRSNKKIVFLRYMYLFISCCSVTVYIILISFTYLFSISLFIPVSIFPSILVPLYYFFILFQKHYLHQLPSVYHFLKFNHVFNLSITNDSILEVLSQAQRQDWT